MQSKFEMLAVSWPYLDECQLTVWDIQAERQLELAVAFEFSEDQHGNIRCTHLSVYNGQNELAPSVDAELKAFLLTTIDARIEDRRASYFEALVDKRAEDDYDSYIGQTFERG